MQVLLARVENVVNDRPLTTVSNDIRDPAPISPNHFLRGKTSNSENVPILPSSVNIPAEYDKLQNLLRHFCNRFRREYFTAIRSVTSRLPGERGARVGDVVLLSDTRAKCFNWPLGRIVKLLPGKDGIARVVLVKSRGSVLRRAIQGLVLLEAARAGTEDRGEPEQRDERGGRAGTEDRDELENRIDAEDRGPPLTHMSTRSGRVIQPVDKFF